MITSIAFAISTTSVRAAHEPTVKITPTLTKAGAVDFKIDVTNTGGSPIIKVEVTAPDGFTLGEWVGTLMADKSATTILGEGTVLPAGTEIPIGTNTLTLAKDTLVTIPDTSKIKITAPFPVILPAETEIGDYPPSPETPTKSGALIKGTTVTLKYDTIVTPIAPIELIKPGVKYATGNVILPAGTEIKLPEGTPTNLPNGMTSASVEATITEDVADVPLTKDTTGKVGSGNMTATLTTPAPDCPLVEDITTTFTAIPGTITVPEGTKVVMTGLAEPILSKLELIADEPVTPWEATTVVVGDAGVTVRISGEVEVGLPPDFDITATVTLSVVDVLLQKGEKIVLPETSSVTLPTGTELSLPIPSGWEATTDVSTKTVTWGSTNGGIGSGESLTFSIRATTTGGEHLWTIMTTTDDGNIAYRMLTTTVDGTPPKIASDDITMKPEMVGAGPATIKIVASEELSKLENVYYQIQDNKDHIGDPGHLIAMESEDGITWTGTLTIPGDGLWDENKVDIEILKEGYEDLAGNQGLADVVDCTIHNNDEFAHRHIDTVPPLLPVKLEMFIAGVFKSPFDNEVNQRSHLIKGTAMDNIGGTETGLEGMTVNIRVGTATYETTSVTNGAFAKEIELAEGPNTIKVWVVDELGNKGSENVQSVFCDSIEPSISAVSVAGKAYEDNVPINDNTPTIVLTIKDPGYSTTGLGVDRTDVVVTLYVDDEEIVLENATPWDKATGRFENTIPLAIDEFLKAGLPEGSYRIVVMAEDVLNNSSEATFWFKVDTEAPSMPEKLDVTNNPILTGTTATEPKVQRKTTLVFYGSDLDPLCDVDIYLIDQATGEAISEETTKTTATGGFSKSLALAEGKTIRIEVETVDAAGNVSSRNIYGYVLADATAPLVNLEALPGTTDKTSVILSGTVEKDDWEAWSDITLTVQVGTGSVEIEIGTEGGYSCSVPMSMGVNTIAVRATDSVGNVSLPATATIERVMSMDTSAPSVTLEALPETTDKVSITIEGTVTKDAWEDWSDITLTVQVGTGKVQVPIGAGGSYNYSIELAEGPNMIVVQATDAVGNAGNAVSDMVERTTTPWGIYAIIFVIIALVMAAIAIFKGPRSWKR